MSLPRILLSTARGRKPTVPVLVLLEHLIPLWSKGIHVGVVCLCGLGSHNCPRWRPQISSHLVHKAHPQQIHKFCSNTQRSLPFIRECWSQNPCSLLLKMIPMISIFKKVKPIIHKNTPSHGKSWFRQKHRQTLSKAYPGSFSQCSSPLG